MIGFDANKFNRQVKTGIKRARKKLKIAAIDSADFGIKKLAMLSPVWAGSYVLSHRIGVNGFNDGGPTNKASTILKSDEIPEKVDLGTAMKFRKYASLRAEQRLQLEKLPKTGFIVIYNRAPHAMDVETLPDRYLTGRMTPYHPYGKAKLSLVRNVPAIVENVERKFK